MILSHLTRRATFYFRRALEVRGKPFHRDAVPPTPISLTKDFHERSISIRDSPPVSTTDPRSKLSQRAFYRKGRGPRDHKHRRSAYGVSLATIICLLAFSNDIPLQCYVACILAAMKLATTTFPHCRPAPPPSRTAHTHVQTHKGLFVLLNLGRTGHE